MEKPNKRVNINISYDMNAWYEEKARSMGQPKSALMSFALMDYMQSRKGIEKITSLDEKITPDMLKKILSI